MNVIDSPRFSLLDTTLRDGSYANGFSFTKAETAAISKALDEAGFGFIEVGHGVGLNAAHMGKGDALHEDVEYVSAAAGAVRRARIGVFCIPGVAGVEHVEAAADAGISFIRVGTEVTSVPGSEAIIRRCKELGLFVFANYMKSYAVSPEFFAEQAARSVGYGADAIYVVDSAGGMFPEDIDCYCDAVRERVDVPLGFHGHDNLSLATANSLHAIERGFSFVDVSLQGLGRSSGNAAAETLVACLAKRYGFSDIGLFDLIEISQRYVIPLRLGRTISPLDVTAGFADFHSSYMRDIQHVSAEYSVDPLALIVAYARKDKVGMDLAELRRIAAGLDGDRMGIYDFSRYYGHEQN